MISTIEYNGFTFDRNNANIQGLIGNGLPDIRASDEVRSQQDGGFATGYRFGNRTFGWSGDIARSTPALYLAERVSLMSALNLQNQPVEGLTMTFNLITGDVWTMREVRVTDANLDMPESEPSRTWNSYQVTFRSTFPFFEGTAHDETQSVTSFDTGIVVPSPVPGPLLGTSASSSPTDPLITANNGSANAYPIFTLRGPGTGFTVTNSTTGQSFTISNTLVAGDVVEIDTWKQTMKLNGADVGLATFSGSFIYLPYGNSTITLSVDSGDTSATTLQTTWNDTYLGL